MGFKSFYFVVKVWYNPNFELLTMNYGKSDLFFPKDSDGEASPDMSGKLPTISEFEIMGTWNVGGIKLLKTTINFLKQLFMNRFIITITLMVLLVSTGMLGQDFQGKATYFSKYIYKSERWGSTQFVICTAFFRYSEGFI